MMWKHLKKVRLVVSLLFFIPICFIFLDVTNYIPISFITFFTSLQIIPSITKALFFTGISTAGFIFVCILTLLFGRVYCSSICPLGTYQDIVIRFSRKVKKKRWFKYKKNEFAFHYAVLAVIVLMAFYGSVVLLNLFEPFSNFGRIVNTFGKPILIILNNTLAFVLGRIDIYILFPIQHQKIVLSVLGMIVLFWAGVTFLSFFQGRMFCNLLCPAGALLGLTSRLSFFKIVINEESCTHCKLCEKVCKANCIDSEKQTIDFAACIGCFNCMDACHTDGVIYEAIWSKKSSIPTIKKNNSRRKFLRSTIVPTISALIPFIDSTKISSPAISGYDESRKHPVSPPGSISVEHFSSLCTACQLCVSSCPTKILQPAFLEYGIAGILQPKMDYDSSFCNYDCVVCSQVCPSGAILPLILDEKKLTQVGRAIFFKDDCIVITKKKDCGACSEHCPTKAVHMVPHEGIFLPEVNEKICIGCGACEQACPTKPRKAIYVESNTVHSRAEKPQIQQKKKRIETIEAFPF